MTGQGQAKFWKSDKCGLNHNLFIKKIKLLYNNYIMICAYIHTHLCLYIVMFETVIH